MSHHHLKKILPFQEHVTGKCPEFYQPLQKLSTDDRMVKSKARTHFRQYIRKKPTKWGYKYSVLGDPTGYTLDFNIYYGAANQLETGHGLAYDVITTPVEPFHFQGYLVFCATFIRVHPCLKLSVPMVLLPQVPSGQISRVFPRMCCI